MASTGFRSIESQHGIVFRLLETGECCLTLESCWVECLKGTSYLFILFLIIVGETGGLNKEEEVSWNWRIEGKKCVVVTLWLSYYKIMWTGRQGSVEGCQGSKVGFSALDWSCENRNRSFSLSKISLLDSLSSLIVVYCVILIPASDFGCWVSDL